MERNELKAISRTDDELRVANYIVLFGGRDLTGEFFTPETVVESAYTKSGILHVDFEHGLDPDKVGMGADEVLGYVDWKTAVVDDTGIFVERVLRSDRSSAASKSNSHSYFPASPGLISHRGTDASNFSR